MSNCQVHRAADRVTPQPNNKAFSTKAPMVSVGIDLRDSAGNGILLKGVTASGTLFLNALKSIVHMNGGFVKMNEDGNFIDKVVFPQLGLEIKGIQYYMNGGLPFKVEDGKSDWENITETRVTSNIMATVRDDSRYTIDLPPPPSQKGGGGCAGDAPDAEMLPDGSYSYNIDEGLIQPISLSASGAMEMAMPLDNLGWGNPQSFFSGQLPVSEMAAPPPSRDSAAQSGAGEQGQLWMAQKSAAFSESSQDTVPACNDLQLYVPVNPVPVPSGPQDSHEAKLPTAAHSAGSLRTEVVTSFPAVWIQPTQRIQRTLPASDIHTPKSCHVLPRPEDSMIIRLLMNPVERKLWGRLYGLPDEDDARELPKLMGMLVRTEEFTQTRFSDDKPDDRPPDFGSVPMANVATKAPRAPKAERGKPATMKRRPAKKPASKAKAKSKTRKARKRKSIPQVHIHPKPRMARPGDKKTLPVKEDKAKPKPLREKAVKKPKKAGKKPMNARSKTARPKPFKAKARKGQALRKATARKPKKAGSYLYGKLLGVPSAARRRKRVKRRPTP